MTEAELLFTEALNCSRISLYLEKRAALDKQSSLFIAQALRRRMRQEPIQYILGKSEFMGLEFKVNKDVFIPRPETEIVIETIIRFVSGVRGQGSGIKILDVGTGSGNIAISLAKSLPRAEIDAVDISFQALKMAKENAKLNNAEINFMHSNLFSNYNLKPSTYNLIISNPPYIPTAEIDNLQPEIQYEPRLALDAGEDGLNFYRRIIKLAPHYLKEEGYLILEIGYGQRVAVENIFKNSGNFQIIEVVKDYNNIERVMVAQWIN